MIIKQRVGRSHFYEITRFQVTNLWVISALKFLTPLNFADFITGMPSFSIAKLWTNQIKSHIERILAHNLLSSE